MGIIFLNGDFRQHQIDNDLKKLRCRLKLGLKPGSQKNSFKFKFMRETSHTRPSRAPFQLYVRFTLPQLILEYLSRLLHYLVPAASRWNRCLRCSSGGPPVSALSLVEFQDNVPLEMSRPPEIVSYQNISFLFSFIGQIKRKNIEKVLTV